MSPTIPDEASLVQRMRERDPQALEELSRIMSGYILNICRGILKNFSDADDVHVFVLREVWKNIENFDSQKGTLAAWVITISHSRAKDHVRKIQTYGRAVIRVEEDMKNKGSEELHHFRAVSASDRVNALRTHLEKTRMPVEQKECIELILQGMSQREIARYTGYALGSVKTRIDLAVKKLRRSVIEEEALL